MVYSALFLLYTIKRYELQGKMACRDKGRGRRRKSDTEEEGESGCGNTGKDCWR